MRYLVTVRYGTRHQRYHTFHVEAPDAVTALRAAAGQIPEDVAPGADLVEMRLAPDADARDYVGGPRAPGAP